MTFRPSARKVLNTLFGTFGQAAQLVFKDKTSVEALVIHRFPDKVLDLMESQITTETNVFEVRLSDVDATKVISQIVMGGKTYTVQGEPIRDQYGLVLRIEAYAS